MLPRAVAAVLVVAAACGARAQGGHDAQTSIDAAGLPGLDDAAPPDAAAGFAIQYTDPDHGPFTGGTRTTIRGVGFRDDDEVRFGGRLAEGVNRLDPKHLEVTTPAGEPGDAIIEVRHTDGTSASKAAGFTYVAIASSPPSGSVAGGTYVVITGYGTDFAPGTLVTFDGVPATGVTIEGAERLTCFTPPGAPGDATIVVVTPAHTFRADHGYAYYATGDPFAGGLSGGPIHGTLNVVVVDAYTSDGVPGAFVAIGDPSTTAWKGTTDALGQITFSSPDLHGPVDVVTAPQGYEVATFDCFDASNLTIFVRPIVPPTPQGPGGVGTSDGTIRGAILFGNATGLGSPYWNLVPEPRTPTELKRVYVTTASSSIFGSPRTAANPIDYHYDGKTLSWPYSITARPGALALVAVAGLYDPAKDPAHDGSRGFTPYAIGVKRGVLLGPTETVDGADIVIDIPLDAAMRVELVDPPLIGTDARGPLQRLIKATVDLGGEGAVMFGAHGLPWTGLDDPPGTFTLPGDDHALTLTGAPPLMRAIGDAGYAFLAGAYTYQGAPLSARIVRGVRDTSKTIRVQGFLGVPRPADPAPWLVVGELTRTWTGFSRGFARNWAQLLSLPADQR